MAETLSPEVVVVGSGPGGALTACLLAEAGKDVLLVEEGEAHSPEDCAPFSAAELRRKYRSGGVTAALGRPSIAYVEGCCLGGGSEVNSALHRRPDAGLLADWAARFDVKAFSLEELLPHFEACEADLGARASSGPAPAASKKLAEGGRALGLTVSEARHLIRPGGERQSMTRTYIPRFTQAGGRVLTGTRVERLSSWGRNWALESSNGPRIEARTVFLACGAVQTPALLRRSGLGRPAGESFLLHPTVKILAVFKEPVNPAGTEMPALQVRGPGGLSFGCSVSTAAHLALHMAERPDDLRAVLRSWRHAAVYYAMVPGSGQGSVRPIPGFRDPLVRYQAGIEELEGLEAGRRKLSDMLLAAGAERLYPSTSIMTAHLFSSCPMGEDRKSCPSDSFGRLRGHPGIHVADASLLCGAPGVNPQGLIMAIVRRNVSAFLGKP
ncbi:MAG: GMC family oxidoreductase [Elusimicrobiota bacterium]